jgi:hypothetical protein
MLASVCRSQARPHLAMSSLLPSTSRELSFSLEQKHVAGDCFQVQAHGHHNSHLRSHHRRYRHQIVVRSLGGLADSYHHHHRHHYLQDLLTALERWPRLARPLLRDDHRNLAWLSLCVVLAFASQHNQQTRWNRCESLIHQQHQVSPPLHRVQLLVSGWTAIHSLWSRPSGGAAHLKVDAPCGSLANVSGEASCHCSPANADDAPLVRSFQLATEVRWPIPKHPLRTHGHQRTNTTDVPCLGAKGLGCVPVVHCMANLRGLASSFAHDWAMAAPLHVATSVLVHSLFRVARTAKESGLVRYPAGLVACSDSCRDDHQRAPNPLLQTLAHTVVGQQARLASVTAQHTHHQLANVVDRRTLETHAIGLVGCVVVQVFGCANLVQRRQHAIFLVWRAQNLHRIRHRSHQYCRHSTARERDNDVSYFAPCYSRECRQKALCRLSCRSAAEPVSLTLAVRARNAVWMTDCQTTMLAGMSGNQSSTRGAMSYCREAVI